MKESNHLGNVRVVLSDRKIANDVGDYDSNIDGVNDVTTPISTTPDGVIDYFSADVKSFTDFYPGGMSMPGRNFNSGDYRFGHNSQEKVDEISGVGNHYTAEFWEYDPRTIRRWNQDPKPNPSISNYNCFAGNPIWFSDILGDTPGKTYDETTGAEIHDDKIDDKKVYTGTKSDGSDRKLVGTTDPVKGSTVPVLKDVTKQFQAQLFKTNKFFETEAKAFDVTDNGSPFENFKARLDYFKYNVTDGAEFDIKAKGKDFSPQKIGEYSFFEGKLLRYDDYGNYNYGLAAKAFGFSKTTAVLGAGWNQTSKALKSWDYAKKNWFPLSNPQGFGDDPKDTYMIKQGYDRYGK